MQIQEQPIEEIGKVIDGRVVLNDISESVAEPITNPTSEEKASPETLQELGKKMATMALELLKDDFKSQKEKGEKAFKETQKKSEMMSDNKIKEMETKHKTEMKGKDGEVVSLKKLLTEKEKEVKELFSQVKDALSEE